MVVNQLEVNHHRTPVGVQEKCDNWVTVYHTQGPTIAKSASEIESSLSSGLARKRQVNAPMLAFIGMDPYIHRYAYGPKNNR